MAKIPFYKIGSALKQNGKIDPNSGKAINGQYKTYTDSVTGKKTDIEYEKGNLGRTDKDAWDERDTKTYGDMSLKQYTDFSKKQKDHYKTTGVWRDRNEMEGFERKDKTAIKSGGGDSGSGVNKFVASTPPSSGDGIGKGIGTFKEWLAGKNNNTSDGSGGKIDINKPITFPEVDLSGGRKAGLVRQFDSKKGGFQGDVLDQDLMKSGTDRSSIRQLRKGVKGTSKAMGATGREARAQAQLAKAVRLNAAAGLVTQETDASGKTVNESATKGLGLDPTAAAGGKARKRAAKAMRRYNRMQHRMKSHEGHNLNKNEIGGQYYGQGDVYNKATGAGDGRDGQLKVGSSGAMNKVKSIVGKTNGKTNGNPDSNTSTPYGGKPVSEFKNVAGTTSNNISGNKKQNRTV